MPPKSNAFQPLLNLSGAEQKLVCVICALQGNSVPDLNYDMVAQLTDSKYGKNAKANTVRLFSKMREIVMEFDNAPALAPVKPKGKAKANAANEVDHEDDSEHEPPKRTTKENNKLNSRKIVKADTATAKDAKGPIGAGRKLVGNNTNYKSPEYVEDEEI